MLESLSEYIKVAVDIRQGMLAGGGILHADCEAALLETGCRQEDIWGADWIPDEREVRFEAMINIRPRQGNRSMGIQDAVLRAKVEKLCVTCWRKHDAIGCGSRAAYAGRFGDPFRRACGQSRPPRFFQRPDEKSR